MFLIIFLTIFYILSLDNSFKKLKVKFLYMTGLIVIFFVILLNINKYSNDLIIINNYLIPINNYFILGYDNLSLLLILLTTILVFLCIIIS